MNLKNHLRNLSLTRVMNISKSMTAIVMMLMLTSFVASGCETVAASVTESRTINSNFYGLILKTNAQVILSQGIETSVRIEGDPESVSSVKTSIENGALVIDGTNNVPVIVYVTVDEINLVEVDCTGSGNFQQQQIGIDGLITEYFS